MKFVIRCITFQSTSEKVSEEIIKKPSEDNVETEQEQASSSQNVGEEEEEEEYEGGLC